MNFMLRKYWVQFLGICSGCLVIISCEDPSSIGEDFVQNEIVDIIFTDTSVIRMSTVLVDSIESQNSGRLLVGFNRDVAVGSIEANSYFLLGTDSVSKYPSESAQYVGAEFELFFDDYFYYDTTQNITLQIFQLVEDYELNEDDVLYNRDQFRHSNIGGPLASASITPRPLQRTSVLLPIANENFGRNLFTKAQEDAEEFETDLPETLKGFVLKTDTTLLGAFLGFSTRSRLTIHYQEEGESYEMVLALSDELHHNYIRSDRNATEIANLTFTRDEINTDLTTDIGYIQAGSSLGLKIDLPGLRDMREVLNPDYILDAKLYLSPIKGSYDGSHPLPESFTIYLIDKLNRFASDTEITVELTKDLEFEDETVYEFDILPFVQYKMESEEVIRDALLILPSIETLNKSVDRVYVGDASNAYKATVKIFILDYII